MNKKFLFTSTAFTGFVLLLCLSVTGQNYPPERIKYELPEITDSSSFVQHLTYSLSYNEKYEQASWVAYTLTKDRLINETERDDNFRPDTLVATGSATPGDYKKSGYDKGHLAPAADMSWSKEDMSESFLMSNMSPQKPGFNRGIWKRPEQMVREFAKKNDTIYIATGPILKDRLKKIGKNKVAVPQAYYKVLIVYKHNEQKGIGFLLKNTSSNKPLQSFAVSIDSVETITGINFFSKIPEKIQEKIESQCIVGEWIKEK